MQYQINTKIFRVRVHRIKRATFQVAAENEEDAEKKVLDMLSRTGLTGALEVREGVKDLVEDVAQM